MYQYRGTDRSPVHILGEVDAAAGFLPSAIPAGEPFDSPDHLFEFKWDGIRCLASVDRKALGLWGRGQDVYTQRYPELAALRQLPAGTILDGELVRFRASRAELAAVLRRHQMTSTRKIGGPPSASR